MQKLILAQQKKVDSTIFINKNTLSLAKSELEKSPATPSNWLLSLW